MNYDLTALRDLINVRIDVEKYPEMNGWQSVLCVDINLYFDGWVDTLKINSAGLMNFYEKAVELVGSDMRWVLINGEGHFRKINKKMFDMLPFWVSPDGPDLGTNGLNMQGGPEKNGRIDKGFAFHRSVASYIRLTLPVEFMLDDPRRFVNLVSSMVKQMRFSSGSAGFSVNLTPDQWEQADGGHLYMLSRRFSGLDLGVPKDWSRFCIHGLKSVNWLTFIGDGLSESIGGRNAIKASLLNKAFCMDLDHSLMIQAGHSPLLGDMNLQEDMSSYRDVALALKSISLPGTDVPAGFWGIGGAENTHRWLNRFHLPNWGL